MNCVLGSNVNSVAGYPRHSVLYSTVPSGRMRWYTSLSMMNSSGNAS